MAVEKLLLAKIESTYGTDPTPDNTNGIMTSGLEVARYDGDTVSRELDKNMIGNQEQVNTNPHVNASFGVELASSGTAGTAPAFGPLLRACGFDETIVAVTSVAYQLPTAQADLQAADSVTLWDYRGDTAMVQKSNGVRGSLALEMGRGALPMMKFSNMLGSYNTPITGSLPTISSWSNFRDPLAFTNDNVATFTVDSYSACVESFNIDFACEVVRRNLPGCSSTLITDYNPTGQVVIKAPTVAAKDFYTALESHSGTSLIPIAITIGSVSGDIVQFSATSAQITNISEGESDGMMTFTLDLSFIDSPIITFL